MSGGGGFRVGIPASLRKTIQDIKEIAGMHSDEDIYAMLKECNMDPNETAQKLLYLDTFHEVKRKRDRRKSNVNIQASEQHRGMSGMQRRGARGGRGNNSSGVLSNDSGSRQRMGPLQDFGSTSRAPLNAGLPGPIHHHFYDAALNETKPTTLVNEGTVRERDPHVPESKILGLGHGTSATEISKSGKRPILPSVAVKQLQSVNPGPTPAPTPTTTSVVASEAGFEGKNSESRSSDTPLSGIYSSASDPVLLPSFSPRNPGAVGTIRRETGSRRFGPELAGTSLPEIRFDAGQDSLIDEHVAPRTISANSKASQGVEKDQQAEPSRSLSLLNDNCPTVAAHQDGWSAVQSNISPNVMTHVDATVSVGVNMPSQPKVNDSVLGRASSQLNRKMEDLSITFHKPVVFPEHLQVPEAFRNGLTFGSLDGASGQVNGVSEETKLMDGTTLADEDGTKGPSISREMATSTARVGEYSDLSHSLPPVPENLSPLEINISPAVPPTSELPKPEIMPPIGGPPYPFLPTAPDYGFGIVPPVLGPHLVHVDGAEVGNSSVSSTSGSSQPSAQTTIGVGQNSVAVSPQLFPYLRQPYPSNYFPYPYFSQLYIPPNAHQFLGHSGFAQQASPGNIYMQPPAASAGVKFPVPSMYKPGTMAANLTHFGIPTGYGSYGSSALGYGINATVTPGSTSSSEDLTAPELKEKNIYPLLKQNEEPHVWNSAPGRDLSSLQANYFYNFPHGQQVTYSPAHSGQGSLGGMYHLTPTTAAPSIVQTLPQLSQTIIGSVDPGVPPAGTYQQPHSRTNWNNKLLNREDI